MLAILGIIAPILEKVLTSVIPDPQARQKAILEIYTALQQSDLAQIDVNKSEADRKSTRLNSSHIPLSRMPSSA